MAAGEISGRLGAGVPVSSSSWGLFAASDASSSSIRVTAGVAPTAPVNGDIWFDGTNLFMRVGGVTKTFTLV